LAHKFKNSLTFKADLEVVGLKCTIFYFANVFFSSYLLILV
jgi:hypothetical protein